MTTTLGQLISSLYATYDQQLHDKKLAAVATEIRVMEFFVDQERARREQKRAKAA